MIGRASEQIPCRIRRGAYWVPRRYYFEFGRRNEQRRDAEINLVQLSICNTEYFGGEIDDKDDL